MTREELIKKAKRKALVDKAKAKAARDQEQAVSNEEAKAANKELLSRSPLQAAGEAAAGGIREGLQGFSFGTSDELEAGARSLFSDKSYGDISSEIQSGRDEYSEAHPVASFAANVSGGLLNPANRLKALNWQPTSVLGRVGKIGQSVAEGALEGFASGREGQRGESAGMGAGFGGLLGGVSQIAGQAKNPNALIGQLDGPEGFTPIPLAAETESGLGGFYRRTVGRAIGGGELMKQQENVLSRADDAIDTLQNQRGRVLRKTTDKIDNLKDQAQETYKQQTRAARTAAEDSMDDVKLQKQLTDIEADDALTAARREGDAARVRRTDQAMDRVDTTLDIVGQQSRRGVYSEAFPESMPVEMRQQMATLGKTDPQAANEALNNAWNQGGFQMVKGHSGFDVNPTQVLGELNTELEPYMAQRLPVLFEQLNTKGVRRMTGTQMMDLRNELAMKANRLENARGEPAIERGVLRSALKKLDDTIAEQLGDMGTVFRREKDNYGNFQAAQDATQSAFANKQGLFDEADFLRAEQRFSGRAAARGQTRQAERLQNAQRIQERARLTGQANKREVGEAVNAATRLAEDTQKTTKRNVAQSTRQAAKEKRKALQNTLNKLGDEKAAQDQVLRNARNKAADAPQVAAFDAQLDDAKGLKKTLQGRSVAKSKGTVEALAATAILGSPVAAALGGGPGGLIAGIPVAMAMSAPSVQRWLAGQGMPNVTPEQFLVISQHIPQAIRTAMIQESQDPELALYASGQ